MVGTDNGSIESRLAILERSVRRTRVIAAGLLCGLIALPLLALGPGASLVRADRVDAREVNLVDDAGNMVMSLSSDAGGSLAMYRPDGDVALALGERTGTRHMVHLGDPGMRGWGVLGEVDPDDRANPAARAVDGVHATPDRGPEAAATLRPLESATDAQRAEAMALVSRGWVYQMPRPKSSSAAWGRMDRRATWFSGYWKNQETGAVSSVVPNTTNGYAGDGVEVPEWYYGAKSLAPSVLEWLCSREGGVPPQ